MITLMATIWHWLWRFSKAIAVNHLRFISVRVLFSLVLWTMLGIGAYYPYYYRIFTSGIPVDDIVAETVWRSCKAGLILFLPLSLGIIHWVTQIGQKFILTEFLHLSLQACKFTSSSTVLKLGFPTQVNLIARNFAQLRSTFLRLFFNFLRIFNVNLMASNNGNWLLRNFV